MKKNNKICLIIIIIYIFIALIALGYYKFNDKNKGYIILSSKEVYYKNNNDITLYSDNLPSLEDVTFITNSETKKLKFKIIDGEIQFYQNDEQIEENFLIAFSPKLNLELQKFTTEELNSQDMQKVEEILKKHGIIGYENLNTKEKVTFDYNKDGKKETIYFISNLFDETQFDKVFSFAYYIEDNQIIYLIEQVDQVENTYNLCSPSINSIIDLNNDNQYELLLSCEYFDNIGTKTQIYELVNSQFKLLSH